MADGKFQKPVYDLTEQEFIELAETEKSKLIERLAAKMLMVGIQCAQANSLYYFVKHSGDKDNLPQAAADKNRLDIEYDVLKHAISALQSTLRIERIGIFPGDNT